MSQNQQYSQVPDNDAQTPSSISAPASYQSSSSVASSQASRPFTPTVVNDIPSSSGYNGYLGSNGGDAARWTADQMGWGSSSGSGGIYGMPSYQPYSPNRYGRRNPLWIAMIVICFFIVLGMGGHHHRVNQKQANGGGGVKGKGVAGDGKGNGAIIGPSSHIAGGTEDSTVNDHNADHNQSYYMGGGGVTPNANTHVAQETNDDDDKTVETPPENVPPKNVPDDMGGLGYVFKDPLPSDTPFPRIAYLLTYPRSGTTYTESLFRAITNSTVATVDALSAYHNSNSDYYPIFPSKAETSNTITTKSTQTTTVSGPFWKHNPAFQTFPPRYILTETHCAGTCEHPCTPDIYVQTLLTFEQGCRNMTLPVYATHTSTFQSKPQTQITYTHQFYHRTNIARAIHLIRNPFDNIVSRFHAARQERQNDAKWTKAHPDTSQGFHTWCAEQDAESSSTSPFSYLPTEAGAVWESVPCHDEFYKYVQWHNLVVQMSYAYEYPTLQVFFEDYHNLEARTETALAMAAFLEWDVKEVDASTLPEFHVRQYIGWYEEEEVKNVEALVRILAFPSTMQILEVYFRKIDST